MSETNFDEYEFLMKLGNAFLAWNPEPLGSWNCRCVVTPVDDDAIKGEFERIEDVKQLEHKHG